MTKEGRHPERERGTCFCITDYVAAADLILVPVAHNAAASAIAADSANVAAGLEVSSKRPPSALPAPTPLMMHVDDHVNASVA